MNTYSTTIVVATFFSTKTLCVEEFRLADGVSIVARHILREFYEALDDRG